MVEFFRKFSKFASSWTGTIIIVLFLIFFVAQSFVIPSGSMKRTQLIGDFLFAKKYSYGIPTPHLPWLEIPLLPDFNGNGHLIEGNRPQREDIVIFRYPKNNKIHYVKRCIATGGDEIIYLNERVLIHFHEGDEYIKENYSKDKIKTLRGKLWVENPYMEKYPGIQYAPEDKTAFETLLLFYSYNKDIDMSPIYVSELEETNYIVLDKRVNALYKKVEDDHFYMVGDNRDNSNDSRFWGSIPYKLIVGKPWLIWMSIETRSYEEMVEKNKYDLQRACGDLVVNTKECQNIWNDNRYTVRWDRIGRRIDSLQLESPTE